MPIKVVFEVAVGVGVGLAGSGVVGGRRGAVLGECLSVCRY